MPTSFRVICAAFAAITVMGCSGDPPELTPQEKAQREARQLAERVEQFPALAAELEPALDGVTSQSVSTMEGAAEGSDTFRRAGLALLAVEDAQLPPATLALRDRLRTKLVRKQTQLYPAIRRSYARRLEREIGNQPITVRAVGAKAKTLRVASPAFGSKEAVAEVHHMLAMQATRLRFTRAEYVWSLNGDYDYYTVHGSPDDDPSPY